MVLTYKGKISIGQIKGDQGTRPQGVPEFRIKITDKIVEYRDIQEKLLKSLLLTKTFIYYQTLYLYQFLNYSYGPFSSLT